MRRDHFLYVRVNRWEKDHVLQAAADRQLPVADYVRVLLRQATNTLPLSPPATGGARPSQGGAS